MGNILKPLLKYPGGKTSELEIIFKNLPGRINNYIEPFVGGGAVYFALENENSNFINDKSEELMLLYEYVREQNDDFFDELNTIISNWNRLTILADDERLVELYINYRTNNQIDILNALIILINERIENVPYFNLRNNVKFENYLLECLLRRMNLIKKNEIKKKEQLQGKKLKDNLEAGIKAAYYTYLRDAYNNPEEYEGLSQQRKVAVYLFIREYCYSSMFRFNRYGGFNVPYGGVSYNKKSLSTKLDYYTCKRLNKLLEHTQINNCDFYEFLQQIDISEDDFMFLDPPYDTTFSEYDKNAFGLNDQERLANYLINECPCRFMLVIKKTDYIENLYRDKGLTIIEENKNYFVSFKNRNKKDVKHLIILNY